MQAGLIHSKIPVLANVDILVVGAGSAGCCAALAARAADARQSVLLVERYGFAGGTSTAVLDTFYGFFTPAHQPRKVVGGIPDRVVDGLNGAGAIRLRPNTYGAGTGVTYNPEYLKLLWDQLLDRAGVRLLLHTFVVDVETHPDGRIAGVVTAGKNGLGRITARRYVDASGDADVCHYAGIASELAGESDPAQTLTTTFRMCNVDLPRFTAAGGNKMLQARVHEAVDSGSHPLPRRTGSAHEMVLEGCVATVNTRIADVDATDPRQLTTAEMDGRRQAFIYEKFFRQCVPGYEKARIMALGVQIGVRETRRVYGEYRLTREDCLTARRFADVVLLCGTPIEDHRQSSSGQEETLWAYVPDGATYDVPYRTLVPRGRDDILIAGRCFSATHDAHASCRSMAQTMAMGQAAGVAAAMSVQHDHSVRQVDIAELQDRLRRLGAILETPRDIADVSPDGWGKTLS